MNVVTMKNFPKLDNATFGWFRDILLKGEFAFDEFRVQGLAFGGGGIDFKFESRNELFTLVTMTAWCRDEKESASLLMSSGGYYSIELNEKELERSSPEFSAKLSAVVLAVSIQETALKSKPLRKSLSRQKKAAGEGVEYKGKKPIDLGKGYTYQYVAPRKKRQENEPKREFTCPGWDVRGHYRHYKSGKVVFVRPYHKGNGKSDTVYTV